LKGDRRSAGMEALVVAGKGLGGGWGRDEEALIQHERTVVVLGVTTSPMVTRVTSEMMSPT
jgi:hypothetical protein